MGLQSFPGCFAILRGLVGFLFRAAALLPRNKTLPCCSLSTECELPVSFVCTRSAQRSLLLCVSKWCCLQHFCSWVLIRDRSLLPALLRCQGCCLCVPIRHRGVTCPACLGTTERIERVSILHTVDPLIHFPSLNWGHVVPGEEPKPQCLRSLGFPDV